MDPPDVAIELLFWLSMVQMRTYIRPCGGVHRFAFEKIFPRLARIRATDEVIAALV